jgi:hypothetical protein
VLGASPHEFESRILRVSEQAQRRAGTQRVPALLIFWSQYWSQLSVPGASTSVVVPCLTSVVQPVGQVCLSVGSVTNAPPNADFFSKAPSRTRRPEEGRPLKTGVPGESLTTVLPDDLLVPKGRATEPYRSHGPAAGS